MLVYVSAIVSLLLTLIIGIPYIEFLKKKLYGQYIREDGPQSHAVKAGTPTTGGLIIIIPALVAVTLSLIMDQKTSIETFIVLVTLVLFTFIGFKDDVTKITKKHNKGLSAKSKLLLQTLIAFIPALFITLSGQTSVSVLNLFDINLGILYPVFAVLVIIGTSNAVNLTDGLDGLATGVSSIVLFAFTIIFLISDKPDLAIVSAGLAASCVGFLYYNKYPAKIFMGDTGSLALGGAIGALAVIGKIELWLLIIGGIFVIETLSVILQVISFKTTGKRIFKMSPIHHHFELSGWHETKVVYTFWAVSLLFAVIACLLYYFI